MPNNAIISKEPEEVKVLVHGSNSGSYLPVAMDSGGIIYAKTMDISGNQQSFPLTAFKELRVAQLTPVAGWNFNYNVNSELVKTTTSGSATITQSNGKGVIQTGTTSSSAASIETVNVFKYVAGTGGLVRFSAIFTTGVAGTTQIIGIGDNTDGFFFGYDGTNFGILRRQNGTDNWTYQSSWNGDKFDGTGVSKQILDKTKGNVYAIRFQWLGFGIIDFIIENAATGEGILAHRITYGNANTNPSIFNPTLPITAKVLNNTTSNNVKIETAGAMAFVEGQQLNITSVRNTVYNSKTNLTTEVAILTIRNKTLFATKTNRTPIKLDFLSVSTLSTDKNVRIRLIKNTTLGGTPAYNDVSTNTSVVDYDIAGTTVTNGKNIISFELGKADSQQLLLDSLNIILLPGDTLTISAATVSGTGADVSVSLSWKELF